MARYAERADSGAQFVADKAKSRLAVLRVMENSLDEARRLFVELKRDAQDWRQRTYAATWLLRLSKMRRNRLELSNCGTQALAEILAAAGKPAAAEHVAQLSGQTAPGP